MSEWSVQSRRVVRWCLMLGVCSICRGAAADLLYDIDFSQPFHMPGLPPTIDLGPAPRRGPSQNNFTAPIVVPDQGPLADGALRFEAGASSLSQIELAVEDPLRGVGVDFAAYRLEFDVVIDNLESAADDFTILFDTPQSNRFNFRGDGLIQYGGGANFIGTFEEDALINVAVSYFGDAGMWSIAVNGDELYSGPTQFAFGGLRSIRLSLDDAFDLDSTVYVDNIVVRGIPEPPAFALLALCPWAVGATRRRRRAGGDARVTVPLRPLFPLLPRSSLPRRRCPE